jgi:hypothetical protein
MGKGLAQAAAGRGNIDYRTEPCSSVLPDRPRRAARQGGARQLCCDAAHRESAAQHQSNFCLGPWACDRGYRGP